MIRFVKFLPLLVLSAGFAGAQDNSSAYNLCNSLPFADDKLECIGVVGDRFFSENAVAICAAVAFASDKVSCLRAIADKKYNEAATRVCASMPFADDKISCLQNAGSPIANCIGYSDIEYKIYSSLKSLRRTHYRDAERTLEDLLIAIKGCQRR